MEKFTRKPKPEPWHGIHTRRATKLELKLCVSNRSKGALWVCKSQIAFAIQMIIDCRNTKNTRDLHVCWLRCQFSKWLYHGIAIDRWYYIQQNTIPQHRKKASCLFPLFGPQNPDSHPLSFSDLGFTWLQSIRVVSSGGPAKFDICHYVVKYWPFLWTLPTSKPFQSWVIIWCVGMCICSSYKWWSCVLCRQNPLQILVRRIFS